MTVPIRSVLANGLLANYSMRASIRLTETRQTRAAGSGGSSALPLCERVERRAGGRAVVSSVWAISRPLPGKHFLKEWNFSRGVVTQDGDHFLFADFVVAIAAFVDGLDDRFELFLRDHGLFSFGFGWGHGDQATALPSCFLTSSLSSFFESASNCGGNSPVVHAR